MADPDSGRLTDLEVEARLAVLDSLLGRIEEMPGDDGETAREAVSALAEIYGEALARVVAVAGADPDVARQLRADELVAHFLALHGVHPDTAERRVEDALAEIAGRLHGDGSVAFAGIDAGVAQLVVSAAGCGAETLASSVREVVLGAVPDLVDVTATNAPPATSVFIPLDAVRRRTP